MNIQSKLEVVPDNRLLLLTAVWTALGKTIDMLPGATALGACIGVFDFKRIPPVTKPPSAVDSTTDDTLNCATSVMEFALTTALSVGYAQLVAEGRFGLDNKTLSDSELASLLKQASTWFLLKALDGLGVI